MVKIGGNGVNNQSTGGNDDDEINATVDAAVNDERLKKLKRTFAITSTLIMIMH